MSELHITFSASHFNIFVIHHFIKYWQCISLCLRKVLSFLARESSVSFEELVYDLFFMQLLKSLKVNYTKHADPYYWHICILWFFGADFPYIFYHSITFFKDSNFIKKIHIAVKILKPSILAEDDVFWGKCAQYYMTANPVAWNASHAMILHYWFRSTPHWFPSGI